MKADLDALMTERGYDAITVTGSAAHNPAMYYLANGVKISDARLVKKRGEPPALVVSAMERDEAAKSGLRVLARETFDPLRILNEEGGDLLRARVRLLERIFTDLGVRGTVATYGREDAGSALAFAQAFNGRQNGVRLVGEFAGTIFDAAWTTKDPAEVRRMRAVGRKTVTVVGNTAEFLQSHRTVEGVLVKSDGAPLTVGDVKREIRRWLVEQNLEHTDDVIFAIGRDAGVPHSHGEDGDRIALGRTIVFDIFPQEAGGGYFFDFTRTWCLGFAPPEVERAYGDVMEVFETTLAALQPNTLSRTYQRRACELFEARGHPTIGSNDKTTKGYTHSLGHGVGLSVHERPAFGDYEGNTDVLLPGCAVTVEPGLYYPDAGGFGVRIEDLVWMNPDTGRPEVLADFPKDLILTSK